MACEDFPCCGHEAGCCPDFDESGQQLNMICVCGAELPADNPVSLCDGCLNTAPEDFDERYVDFEPGEVYEDEDVCFD